VENAARGNAEDHQHKCRALGVCPPSLRSRPTLGRPQLLTYASFQKVSRCNARLLLGDQSSRLRDASLTDAHPAAALNHDALRARWSAAERAASTLRLWRRSCRQPRPVPAHIVALIDLLRFARQRHGAVWSSLDQPI